MRLRFGARAQGTIGAAGAFSFYPTKNLGATGDGGAVITETRTSPSDSRLRHYGQADRYRHEGFGVNSRLDEIQAAVVRAKLPHLEEWTERRREIASHLLRRAAGWPRRAPWRAASAAMPSHLFVVRAPDRERLRADLSDRGIATLIHYPLPIHRQPVFAELAGGPVPLRGCGGLGESVLSLPLYPELTEEEIDAVAAAAADAANQPA